MAGIMKLMNQTMCERCGRGMQTVAEIAPMGNGPGLVAFLCTDCGNTESTLVYPENRTWQTRRQQAP
jgi:hypothetical protein